MAFRHRIQIGAFSVFGVVAVQLVAGGALHPGYERIDIRPDTFTKQVTGMELLPNGDLLVLTWRGATDPRTDIVVNGEKFLSFDPKRVAGGELYRISGAQGRDKSQVTAKKIAGGFKDALGLTRVGDDIFVLDIDKLYKLTDLDAGGVYQGKQEILKLPSYDGWFEYASGPVVKDGKFYLALCVAVQGSGWPAKQRGPDRGTLISTPLTGGSYEVVVSGLRAPNGISVDSEGEVFVTDNQGGYRPTSPILNLRPGRWYGYQLDPPGKFQKEPLSLPAAWLPFDDLNRSPTELVYVKSGLYAGQFFYGEVTRGGLYRFAYEKVMDPVTHQEELQGAVFLHSAGLGSGSHRLRLNDKGEIYIGGLRWGAGDPGVGTGVKDFGLEKLVPRAGVNVFEILAVHARKEGMELEFTQPLPATTTKDNFFAEQWRYEYKMEYGQGKQPNEALTIADISLSPNRKSAYLHILGMKDKAEVIHIKTKNLKSEGGSDIWQGETWYTMLNYSDKAPFSIPTALSSTQKISPVGFELTRSGLEWVVSLPEAGDWHLDIFGGDGHLVSSQHGQENSKGDLRRVSIKIPSAVEKGLGFFRLKQSQETYWNRFVNP